LYKGAVELGHTSRKTVVIQAVTPNDLWIRRRRTLSTSSWDCACQIAVVNNPSTSTTVAQWNASVTPSKDVRLVPIAEMCMSKE
jgi:hypothetical protein